MAEREIMTVEELAAYLRVHPSTIYRALKFHRIPAFRMGADWRFIREEIDKWCIEKSKVDSALGAWPHAGGHPRPAKKSVPE